MEDVTRDQAKKAKQFANKIQKKPDSDTNNNNNNNNSSDTTSSSSTEKQLKCLLLSFADIEEEVIIIYT